MNVVNLNRCRELLARWNEVRRELMRGDILGFALTLMHRGGRESVHLGGAYAQDPEAALRGATRMCWEITKDLENQPGQHQR